MRNRTLRFKLRAGRAVAQSILLLLSADIASAQIGGGGQQLRSPEAGNPRPWEAGVNVTPFSVVNLYNGNMVTELPLADFGTVEPYVRFTFSHNSAAANSTEAIESPVGFSLGGGWITAYGGAVVDNADGTVTLLEDDGNEYDFTLASGVYVPQTGVHDHLAWDAGNSRWVLTRPDQWRRIFDSAGRLVEVQNAAGSYVRVERDPDASYRIVAVVSADETSGQDPDERLVFAYNATTGKLESVTAPDGKQWTFEYDANGRLWKFHEPTIEQGGSGAVIILTYNTGNRILTVTDGAGDVWTHAYSLGRPATITDPAALGGAQQTLSYSHLPVSGYWETYYNDRLSADWSFRFEDSGAFLQREDADENLLTLTYDGNHNPTSIDDGFGTVPTATWGPAATLTSIHTRASACEDYEGWNDITLNWEQPDPTNRPNFWRRALLSDILGNSIQYNYTDPNDPTRAVTIVQQRAGGQPEVVDGIRDVYPVTGLGSSWRQYWDASTYATSPGGRTIRHFSPTEASVPPIDGDTATGEALGNYRWRFTWVIFPFAGHIGIDYVYAPATPRHVNYGQPPDMSGCSFPCCIAGVKFSNNRWGRKAPMIAFGDNKQPPEGRGYYSGNETILSCFENDLPRNWGDCCMYCPAGVDPYSNSNGGAHAAILKCVGANYIRPDVSWLCFAPGWANFDMGENNTVCPGYKSTVPDFD